MTATWLLFYVGGAIGYAAGATAVLGGVGFAAGVRWTTRALPVLFVTLVFVFLTQHPFPEAQALRCPRPGAEPNLTPLTFVSYLRQGWDRSPDLGSWLLRDSSSAAVAMNVLLCAVIGGLLRPLGLRFRTAVLSGFGLSLAVELTQLTGTWGLYPCPYRKFDVDDLLLNTMGVALGALMAGYMRRG